MAQGFIEQLAEKEKKGRLVGMHPLLRIQRYKMMPLGGKKHIYIDRFARDMRNKPTPIERKVLKALRSFGVKFHQQYVVGNYIVDFALIDARAIIECDGYQYHQDADKEHARDAYLHLKGYTVLHLLGWQIHNKVVCRGLLMDFLTQLGLLRPVATGGAQERRTDTCAKTP